MDANSLPSETLFACVFLREPLTASPFSKANSSVIRLGSGDEAFSVTDNQKMTESMTKQLPSTYRRRAYLSNVFRTDDLRFFGDAIESTFRAQTNAGVTEEEPEPGVLG